MILPVAQRVPEKALVIALGEVQALMRPASVGPYEFVGRFSNQVTGQYIHLFRLRKARDVVRLPNVAWPSAPFSPVPGRAPAVMRFDPNG